MSFSGNTDVSVTRVVMSGPTETYNTMLSDIKNTYIRYYTYTIFIDTYALLYMLHYCTITYVQYKRDRPGQNRQTGI